MQNSTVQALPYPVTTLLKLLHIRQSGTETRTVDGAAMIPMTLSDKCQLMERLLRLMIRAGGISRCER
jgi:hypothetical protein